jgi:hypothetical protein
MPRADAQYRLRRSIELGLQIRFTSHARREMAKDKLDENDIINLLRRGLVQEPEWENGEWRYQVKQQEMTAVLSFHENPDQTVVVTVWRHRW